MKNLLKRLLLPLMLSGMILLPQAAGTAAAWNPLGSACNQNKGKNSAVCQDNRSTSGNKNANPFLHAVVQATQIIIIIAGVAAVIMIIVSGIKFMTSGGDPNQSAQARRMLTNSLVGLLVVVLAQAIVSLVVGGL